MTMRKVVMVLALLLPAQISAAQGSAILSGRVLEAAAGAPIGFASILVENPATGEQLTGTLAGENGRFVLQGLTPGTYRVRISFAGFHPAEADLVVSTLNPTYDLGDIRLPRLEGFKDAIT